MKKEIPIMFCFDKNYVIPAGVAFFSLMEHANQNYNYKFYILHSDINENQQERLKETVANYDNCKIEFINMQNRLEKEWKKSYRGDHFSKEVMYKLLTASIFPQYDKLIVSDVDVVFLGDISQSYFELDAIKDDVYIAGVKPVGKTYDYFENYKSQWTENEIKQLGETCGGYLVMNLKKIREDNIEKAFLQSLKRNAHRLNQMEQDILNIVCHGKIKQLDLKYVVCSYMWDYYKCEDDFENDKNYSKEELVEAMQNPIQLHYATSIKPWKNVNCTKSEIWFEYIVKTPFLKEYLDWLPYNIVIPKASQIQYVNNGKIKRVCSYIKRNPLFLLKLDFYKKVINYGKRKFKKYFNNN